ncbi:MAG TPA: hypothetical protein VF787_10110 [Thermoanaerobaculia bacterium]
MTTESNRRRTLSALAFFLFALLLFASAIAHLAGYNPRLTPTRIAVSGFLAPLVALLLAGGLVGVTQLLRDRADRTGLLGAALSLLGWTIGARIIALRQLQALSALDVPGVPADATQKLLEFAPIVFVSIVPIGLLYPIGMTILGVALFVTRPVPRWIGASWIAGAILFPVGRAIGVIWAFNASDLLLGAAFLGAGWMILKQPRLTGAS